MRKITNPAGDHYRHEGPAEHSASGFTVAEIMLVLLIITTVCAIAVPIYMQVLNNDRITRAVGHITMISLEINMYRAANDNQLPQSLAAIGEDWRRDPWGHPYEYLVIEGLHNHGQVRKDRNLVPINSDYDLYSLGKDGQSSPPLTAHQSLDDIVRANDGAFIGLASRY